MVFRYKVLNLTRMNRTQSMTRKMFQIAVIITSTISNPISIRRKSQARNMNQINLRCIHHFQISLWLQ
ncbi:Uncharacterised protein [Mycobacterium tuberculosis]|nr:Uncharacterised protein [Mycobacterium tuberculosis]